MFKSSDLLRAYLLFPVLALFWLGQGAGYAEESIGTLKQFEGAVELSRKSHALTVDMPMYDEDRISTGEGAAEVTFKDGSLLKIRPNSDMTIQMAKKKRKILGVWTKEYLARIISIRRGEAAADIKPHEDLATEFETISAITAVRGTALTVGINDEGYTIIQNEKGEVECFSQDGWVDFVLNTGESMGAYQCPPPENVVLLVCYGGTIEIKVGQSMVVLDEGEQVAVAYDPETGIFSMAAVVGEIETACGGEKILVPEGLGCTCAPGGEPPTEPTTPTIDPCYFVEPEAAGTTFSAPPPPPPPPPPPASPAQ